MRKERDIWIVYSFGRKSAQEASSIRAIKKVTLMGEGRFDGSLYMHSTWHENESVAIYL